jgi:large subunit ribosomal protein L4
MNENEIHGSENAGLDVKDCTVDDVADAYLEAKLVGHMMPVRNANMDETLLAKPGAAAVRSPVMRAPVMSAPKMSASPLISSWPNRGVSASAIATGADVKVPVYDLSKKEVGEATLDGKVFAMQFRGDILHQHVKMILANKRQGSACTLTRSDVTTSKKKILAQKGSGSARKGSKNSPTMRGGGVAFGPKPRSFRIKMNKKVKKIGLAQGLSYAAQNDKLSVLNKVEGSGKTKEAAAALKNFGEAGSKFLIIDGEKRDPMFAQATRNIPKVQYAYEHGFNVYDLMNADKVLITQEAVDLISKRYDTPAKPESAPEPAPESA